MAGAHLSECALGSPTSGRQGLIRFLDGIQVLTASAEYDHGEHAGPLLSRLIRHHLPIRPGIRERLVVKGAISELVVRNLPVTDDTRRAELADLFVQLARCETRNAIADVSLRLMSCRRCIWRAIRAVGCGADPFDPRIGRTVSLLQTRYADQTLTLRAAAREARLSTWYLSRLLSRHTGRGFSDHLHSTRIAAAQRLLQCDELSVKEIAAKVGYSNTVQLDRHFKRLSGCTPMEFRRRYQRRAS